MKKNEHDIGKDVEDWPHQYKGSNDNKREKKRSRKNIQINYG